MRRLVFILLLNSLFTIVSAQINIWEGTPVHKHVELTPYMPDSNSFSSNVAIIVCPGGSYFWHDINTEGHEVGKR